MKLLIVGCGSIGTRHAGNAAQLGEAGVVDFDPEKAKRIANARPFASLEEGLAWRPDGVVVAVPNHLHLAIARKALAAGAGVLIEKPISDRTEGLDAFLKEAAGRPAFVACNLRFHPGPATLKKHLREIGPVLFARAHFGNYLPAMRPGVDYRTLYAARRAEGGGVILDAIHEIDYLSWLFGPIEAVNCRAGRISSLEIETEDHALVSARHAGGVQSSIELDYLRKFKSRGCEIIGERGVLHWQSDGKAPERCTVRLYREATGAWENLFQSEAVDNARPYQELLAHFAGALKGKPAGEDGGMLLDAGLAARELRAALAALRSAAEQGTEVLA